MAKKTRARNRKGHFIKGASRSGTTAIVVAAPRSPARRKRYHAPAKKHRRSRGRSGGGKVNLMHLGLAAGALAYLTSQGTGPQMIVDNVNKIPGAKTFGGTAIAGIACLAADKFVKPNKWLRLAGYAGVIAAAMQVGKAGTGFKWVGDDDVSDYDIGDDDDVGSLDP